MKIFNKNKKDFGFTLVEVLIACSIISVSIFALIGTAQNGILLSEFTLKKSQASMLLEEGVEAVKFIRDGSWANISALSLNTTYYLYFDNTWSLTTSPVNAIDGFTRTVTINSVSRDANDDIVISGGTLDPKTKKITVNVTWVSSGTSNTDSISFYLFDIFN